MYLSGFMQASRRNNQSRFFYPYPAMMDAMHADVNAEEEHDGFRARVNSLPLKTATRRSKRVKLRRVVHQDLLADRRIRRPYRQQVQYIAVVDLEQRRQLARLAPELEFGCGQFVPQRMRSAFAAISARASGKKGA